MDEDLSNLPDDVAALKQVLKMALAKGIEGRAEAP
jgi:hypothetical protein